MAARKKAAAPAAKPAKPTPSPKPKETKQQRLIAMLKRPDIILGTGHRRLASHIVRRLPLADQNFLAAYSKA
jgi:hypothetical protein